MQVDFEKGVNSDVTTKGFQIDDNWSGLFDHDPKREGELI